MKTYQVYILSSNKQGYRLLRKKYQWRQEAYIKAQKYRDAGLHAGVEMTDLTRIELKPAH